MKSKAVADILAARRERRFENEKPYTDYIKIVQAQEQVLGRFQSVFAPGAIDSLADSDFRDFLSFKHNHHWTGLQRATSHVCDDMPKLRAALSHLFNESVPIVDRINDLTNRGRVRSQQWR